ncbi:MAG: UvrD-helicase domain-containing protein [Pseudomonadales bacterium]|nr:UvrD-helicase domain-containing protein [Pseudomonadales bacterium]
MEDLSVTPNFIGKLIGKIKEIRTSNDGISLIHKNNNETTILFSELIDLPVVKTSFLGKKLSLQTINDNYNLSFLNKEHFHQSLEIINKRAIQGITENAQRVHSIFKNKAIDEYFRDSEVEYLNQAITPLITNYESSKEKWNNSFDANVIDQLSLISSYIPLKDNINRIRSEYETKTLRLRKEFYDKTESNPLTEQQRLAVIRNNDRNLVLAAAGTGKTSVMVAKALDLIESGKAKKEEILILAYNKAASKELKERIIQRGSSCGISENNCPSIYTFHALGRQILKEAKIQTYLSDFSDDPIKLEMWVSKWLVNYIQASPQSLKTFIELSSQPINPFDFNSKEEYDAYVRDNEYRTLQGERVKGYQELLIANWLFMNSVEYEYEAPYITKRRIEVGFDYRPDFHLKGSNIYLEHFGIDRNGNTRKDIDKTQYSLEMESKRQLHNECQTILLETFHYDWIEDNLEDRLKYLMDKTGIEIKEKTPEELFEVLKNTGTIEKCAQRYLKCLQAIRVERLDKELIIDRLKSNKIVKAVQYSEILDSLHSDYVKELDEQGKIDFDDMIIRAISTVNSGAFTPSWKHILVDEFQDISKARMDFLNALVDHGKNPILTVVGDDWQSIYRFSGGKLELTTRFNDLVGSHSLTKLEKTFRYNNSIANTAGTFVMKNPEQYEKHVTTHTHVDSSQVYLLDSKVDNKNNLEDKAIQIINTIKKNDPTGSIAILARYRYLLNNIKENVKSNTPISNVKYWTFHGSKGLEADYCILVGFFQGKSGFPNMNKEEAVVESLLPSLDSFPHSEERRLLYVAITRAKKKCYLIADSMAPSEFINELLTPQYDLHIASQTFEERYRKIFKCPICTDGYFRLVSGKYGEFYSCSSGSICNSKPRKCESCGAPSIDTHKESVCNNVTCGHKKPICDRCGRPMKLKDGKFGKKFFGCTGFGIKDDQCKHTRKYIGV